jgi:hypothetical protein
MNATPTLPTPLAPRERWFAVGLLLFFVALSVQYSFKVRVDEHRDNRSAILRWRDQILDLDRGVNIFEYYNYPNPPIMVLLLEPIVHLPPLVCSLVWFYLKVAMVVAAVALTLRLVESPERPFPAWAKALTVVLSLRPIMGDLSHGNINIFILFLVVAALFAYRHRREPLAGLLLALAIACKVTPALFVPYFLWKRSWRTLAGCAAGLVLFFWLVPGLFFGMERNATFLHSWYERMIAPFVFNGAITPEHNNQSLPGVLIRLLTKEPSFTHYEDDHYVADAFYNVADLDPALVRLLIKGCMLAFALAAVWACRTPTTPRHGWRLAAEYSLVVLGMLLFSERTWKHHCVTLLLPFGVIAYWLATQRAGLAVRAYLVGTLAVVALLMASTSTGMADELEAIAKVAQTYGAYVWAYLLLVVALVVLLRRRDSAVQAQQHVGTEPTSAVAA